MISLSIEDNLDELAPRLRVQGDQLGEIFLSDGWGDSVLSYITRVTDRYLTEMGRGIGEQPDKRSSRGQEWLGWATRERTIFGIPVVESTRFRWRAHKRGESGWHRSDVGGIEKVWLQRASGASYGPSDIMMQDTRALQGSILTHVRRTTSGTRDNAVMTLVAGEGVPYFREQHEQRPIWNWYEPEDMPRLVELLEEYVRRVIGP